MNDFFTETAIALLEAIDMERGNVPIRKVLGMPADTYRADISDEDEDIRLEKYKAILKELQDMPEDGAN